MRWRKDVNLYFRWQTSIFELYSMCDFSDSKYYAEVLLRNFLFAAQRRSSTHFPLFEGSWIYEIYHYPRVRFLLRLSSYDGHHFIRVKSLHLQLTILQRLANVVLVQKTCFQSSWILTFCPDSGMDFPVHVAIVGDGLISNCIFNL